MINTIDDLIEAFGGLEATAQFARVSVNAVYNWRKRERLPTERYFDFAEGLQARGKPAPSRALFGFPETTIAAE